MMMMVMMIMMMMLWKWGCDDGDDDIISATFYWRELHLAQDAALGAEHEGVPLSVAALHLLQAAHHRDLGRWSRSDKNTDTNIDAGQTHAGSLIWAWQSTWRQSWRSPASRSRASRNWRRSGLSGCSWLLSQTHCEITDDVTLISMIIFYHLMLQHGGVEGQSCSMRWGNSKLRTIMEVSTSCKISFEESYWQGLQLSA